MNKNPDALDIIKEYLASSGCTGTLEAIEEELKSKQIDIRELEKSTVLVKTIQSEKEKTKKLATYGEKYKQLDKKHKGILSCARQIFSIVINCLQQLHNIKDVFL